MHITSSPAHVQSLSRALLLYDPPFVKKQLGRYLWGKVQIQASEHISGTLLMGKRPYNTFYRGLRKRSVHVSGQNRTFPGHYGRANGPTIRSIADSRNVVSTLLAKTALFLDTTDGETVLQYGQQNQAPQVR